MTSQLDHLAESHGIQNAYVSELGEREHISDDAKRALLTALGVDPDNGVEGSFDESEDRPSNPCAMPDRVSGKRLWGVSCQLYSLRSDRNLGIGDFADLAQLAEIAGQAGAAFVGVNPLHALFSADPGRYSPYSPSTRRFLNPLYIAVDRLAGGSEAIEKLRGSDPSMFEGLDSDLVDYPAVGRLKMRLLREVFAGADRDGRQSEEFRTFKNEDDDSLRGFALFEAISEDQVAKGGYAGWHSWPDDLKNHESEAVAAFRDNEGERIDFHVWLQFIAERQLAAAQDAARAADMPIGLYLDLAVGVTPDGAETWSDPSLIVSTARVGSPPDMFNSSGQDWGLAPLSPKVLAERDYKPLRESFRALTRNAGAVRIDHAMGLARLWWIPTEASSAGGGYVRYPLGRMVDSVADASVSNDCLVIGEDLGTVPPGFRNAMANANILSYRVLYFERHRETEFLPPDAYPDLALACVSTHDLATLAGWWKGHDVKLREEVGTQDAEATKRDLANRRRDRRALIIALADAALLPEGFAHAATGEDDLPPELPDDIDVAVHRFIARTPSMLVTVQLEDMLRSERQPNLPGTTDQYPNWRIRSDVSLDDVSQHSGFQKIAAAMREERPVSQ